MPINVVLYEPEIPQNTGNIIRTCVATNTKLHLIEPLGFDLYKKDVKRSTANHLEGLNYELYPNYNDFISKNKGTYIFITRYGNKPPSRANLENIEENIYLIFGNESSGIPYSILKSNINNCFRLPMSENARSLNLSNCVAIVVYEALRQQDYYNLSLNEIQKGADFLEQFDLKK